MLVWGAGASLVGEHRLSDAPALVIPAPGLTL